MSHSQCALCTKGIAILRLNRKWITYVKPEKINISQQELPDTIYDRELQFLGPSPIWNIFVLIFLIAIKNVLKKVLWKMSDQVRKYIRILDIKYWCNNHWRFFFQFLYSLFRYCVILFDMRIVYASFVKSHYIHIFDNQMSYSRLPFKFLTFCAAK
jgi:hypothetical protein